MTSTILKSCALFVALAFVAGASYADECDNLDVLLIDLKDISDETPDTSITWDLGPPLFITVTYEFAGRMFEFKVKDVGFLRVGKRVLINCKSSSPSCISQDTTGIDSGMINEDDVDRVAYGDRVGVKLNDRTTAKDLKEIFECLAKRKP